MVALITRCDPASIGGPLEVIQGLLPIVTITKIYAIIIFLCLKQSKIPLKRLQVVDLVRKLDPNRTGYVDYSHYRVEEPVKKPKKNGDEEEEEEDDEAEK